jgi:hypothetical protein
MRELKRSIEAGIGSDNDRQQEAPPAPYKLRALGKWISDDARARTSLRRSARPSGNIDSTSHQHPRRVAFNDVFQSIFQQVGGRRSYTLFAGPYAQAGDQQVPASRKALPAPRRPIRSRRMPRRTRSTWTSPSTSATSTP